MSPPKLRAVPNQAEPERFVPPHNLEAEESVLGSMILSSQALEVASQSLTAEDFWKEEHRTIFRAIIQMHESGQCVDNVTLADALERQHLLDSIGNRAYLLQLTGTTPNPGSIQHYCGCVKEAAVVRRREEDAKALASYARDSEEWENQLAKFRERHIEGRSPQRFFDGNTFVPKRLADLLLSRHSFKHAGGMLYVYKEGAYRPGAERLIEGEANRLLGERSVTNRIKETVDYIKRGTETDHDETGADAINLANGRLDWESGQLLPHDPQVFETTQLPVTYDPDATCPEFDRFLETTLDPALIPLVEEIMGYCLVPDIRFEKAFLLTGTGSNGKSVFLDVLTALLGSENVSGVDLQSLEENRFAAASLVGKLANIHADLDSRALKSSKMFKPLVTGDTLSIERKYCEPFEYRNTARLIFSANSMPLSPDKSYAFYRRLVIVPFEITFSGSKADKHLREKLTTPDELRGILNRALAGLKRLYDRSDFSVPEKAHACLEEYKRQNDSVAAFIDEFIEVAPDERVVKREFRGAYCQWCEDQGMKPMSERAVKESLRLACSEVGEGRDGNKGPWCWTGIMFKESTVT